MATKDERLKILEMIKDGKISAEDGSRLLAALSKSTQNVKPSFNQMSTKHLRVRVTDMYTGKSKVSDNLPLGLVDAGLSIAANFVPELGIEDLSEAIKSGISGKIVDVLDEEDGDHVEIFIE